ncbi:glycosyltransferase family 2 protein [Cronbergia sp. UHCC 0137]|uniref:glycosyltransferase n=1 Tax=Cronbergia sp. UHCC 0137 TaxID=3110239 RepID=UPI002B1EE35B|nr:glycosyltransferase family 2 protein [Cronbergia sp. UHCC 0137]MEA5617317.1 glycosyltransferase family 2 protein [Cronbergia sp. UHCC 0137]
MQDLMIFLSKSLISWLGIQICLILVFLWYLRSPKQNLLSDEQLPKTAVILCLRGADPFLPNCVRSLLQQNYPQYDLKIVIDSQEDPAFKVVKEAINELGATNFQISTLNTFNHNCSLKCNALIQTISNLDNSYKIVALVDADTVVHPNWLRELVTPLLDATVGVTTGNRWYLPTGNYWGSMVRYVGNLSTVVQMFLFQIPWGGSLAIKTEMLHQIEIMDQWGKSLNDDLLMHNLIKKHNLKIKFVPSALIINREDCNLFTLHESLKRLLLSCRLYHPYWLAIVSESISSILFPTLVVILIFWSLLEGQLYQAFLLFGWYSIYTVGLLLIILLMEVEVQKIIHAQGQAITKLTNRTIMRILLAIPLTQWVYGLAIISSLRTSTITWRGITYRLQGASDIRLVEYHPYQWLDQPTDGKVSL